MTRLPVIFYFTARLRRRGKSEAEEEGRKWRRGKVLYLDVEEEKQGRNEEGGGEENGEDLVTRKKEEGEVKEVGLEERGGRRIFCRMWMMRWKRECNLSGGEEIRGTEGDCAAGEG